jgi:hypothetical protein
MKIISHRGNVDGRFESCENEPTYIDLAIKKGFEVEVDVWYKDNVLWLGHDKPDHAIDFRWFRDRFPKLWIHCKNLEALEFMAENKGSLNGFWHQEDSYTFTTKGYIWTYPNNPTTKLSILVHLGMWEENISEQQMAGICSDFMTGLID